MGGTYVLVIDVQQAIEVDVGALGTRSFRAGAYAYVGTAFGPGGYTRIDRHRELAHGERDVRHWHVDYLLGHHETRLESAITFPDVDRECDLAARLPGDRVDGIGASDCDCPAHLVAAPSVEAVREAAVTEGGTIRQ